ncbi:acyltransferase [Kibdelosporangium aridum]|uniref:Acyltransferase n=1 Tax=Kibdelosporangium aridum TaxID=2030 RepID=A0A428ZB21_KIBAR|nr:acyltransferase family protein [Kibdelosporangium aridum]RSM85277.1 acyltransferase [Kibdelosporangium aridum]
MSLLPRTDRLPPSTTTPETTPRTGHHRYRPELQGLRALAAMLVVVYHVWLGRVSGGVDVFFLISGFLVTGQLFRAADRGRIAVRVFWGRLIKRLFPAALTVLAVVMAISVVFLPENRWFQTIREIVASALYLENWQLATDSVDYYAQNQTASVVQHFWSLSIQGQFYVVWPVLVASVVVIARMTRQHLRFTLFVVLLALFVASLLHSIWLTTANQPLAYFHSLTRVWEFAFGGLLALGITSIAPSRALRIVLGWIGVVGLVSCGIVLHVGSLFPGYLALWPVTAAALILLAGQTASPLGADRLLSSRPMRYLGDLSYSLYLWHWPVLVFYLVVRDRTQVGILGGLGVITLSLLLSMLTYHFVEEPVRRSRIGEGNRWGAYRFGIAVLVPIVAAAVVWKEVSVRKATAYAISMDDPDHPGAMAQVEGFEYWGAPDPPLLPPLVALPTDWSAITPHTCYRSTRNKDLEVCSSVTDDAPARRLVLVGDSHVHQYAAALGPVARHRNWQLTLMNRGSCPFSTNSETVIGDKACKDWNSAAVKEIVDLRPDAVVTLASRNVRIGLTEETPVGFVEQWRALEQAGIPVLAIRDNPRYNHSPSVCANTHGRNTPQCNIPRAEIIPEVPSYASLDATPSNVSFLDFSNYFCTPEICPPVIGNILVYMDDNHITATFMTTMSAVVEKAVHAALGWELVDQPAS